MSLGRSFIPLRSIPQSTPGTMQGKLTVLTYNMLSPYYMWPQVYTYVPEKYKKWNYRHKLLEREILTLYRADIMCLQEMTSIDYQQYWRKVLWEKYHYGSKFIAKPPPGYWERPLSEMDGVSIFYDLNKFDYISSTGIYLNDLFGTFDLREQNYLEHKMVQLTDGCGNPTEKMTLSDVLKGRNQVCMFVSLRHKETNTFLIVVNTHLYWKYDEVKLTQCIIIMRRLSKIIKNLLIGVEDSTYNKVKIVFAGDMNSDTDSLVVKFLKGDPISHENLKLVNPMRPYLNRCLYDDIPKDIFVHTCFSGKLKGVFDYICYNNEDMTPSKVLGLSKDLQQHSEMGLPNALHPSDHIPMVMEFEVR